MQNHFLQLIIPPISYIKPCFYLIGQKACFPAFRKVPAGNGEGINFPLENSRVLCIRHGHDNGPPVVYCEAPGGECSSGAAVMTAEHPIIPNPEEEGKNWWAGFLLKMTSCLHEWMGMRTKNGHNITPWVQLKSHLQSLFSSWRWQRFTSKP